MLDLNTPIPATDIIKTASEATFMADVIEASKTTPVIVIFTAPMREPCQTLTPALESEVTAAKGKIKLVKLDVDKSPRIAQSLRVQSIPAVFAFVNGQPIDGFMGAKTPSEVKTFVAGLLGGAPDDGLEQAVEEAQKMLDAGDTASAIEVFAAVRGEDPANIPAFIGLVRAHIAAEDMDSARDILAQAPPDLMADAGVIALTAQMDLIDQARGVGDIIALRVAVDKNPADFAAQFDLALAELAAQRPEAAMDALLAIFARDATWNDGAAKDQLLKIFESLGADNELAQAGRRRLASIIFS